MQFQEPGKLDEPAGHRVHAALELLAPVALVSAAVPAGQDVHVAEPLLLA